MYPHEIFLRECMFPQVHMDVIRPQVHPLTLHKATCGTHRISHHLLQPSSMAATDLLLDPLLQ